MVIYYFILFLFFYSYLRKCLLILERERNISWVASHTRPDQELNPQPKYLL